MYKKKEIENTFFNSAGITRVWHGIVDKEDTDIYFEYLIETGVKDYKSTTGLLSADILKRMEGEVCHFYTITKWESYDSIKKFAGEDFTKAKYYPKDKAFLLEQEEEVRHFETFSF